MTKTTAAAGAASAPGRMLRLFSVSMPRAGHHVAEMVLGRLMGSRFAYCEFYTARNCCRGIPCTRFPEWEGGGAIAFMQKSHDHNLSDPADPAYDGLVIQVREPVARALSNYELDLSTVGPPHSPEYKRFWLGLEAAYTVGFIAKWCAKPDPRAVILTYEELIADPVAYYRRLFERFGLPMALFDEQKVLAATAVSSGDGKRPFRERDIRASKHYDEEAMAAFQRLVAPAAAAIGYRPHPALEGASGDSQAVTLAYEARRALLKGDNDEALARLDRYLALPDAHIFARRIRAQVFAAKGEARAAEAELGAVTTGEPGHPRAWIDLAEMQRRRGQAELAKATLDRCLAVARDPKQAARWILDAFGEPALTAEARRIAPPPAVTREDVVAAFRFILGREPEGEAVIESHQNIRSVAALRETLLRSTEFAEKYAKIAGAPAR